MAHLAAIPALEFIAEEVAPALFEAGASYTLGYSTSRLHREGILGESLMKRKFVSPSPQQNKRMRGTPRTLFGTSNGGQTSARASRYRAELGRKPGKFMTRRTTFYGGIQDNDADCELHGWRLIKIPWSEDESIINARRGKLVNVRGVRCRVQFQIDRTLAETELGTRVPLEIRWAVINPKANDGAVFNATNFNPEFFITRQPTTSMSTNFDPSLRYWTYQHSQINREKYGVVKEGRFLLSPNFTSKDGALTQSMNKLLQFYVPVSRQMKFPTNGIGADEPEANLYFVWWYTVQNKFGTSPNFNETLGTLVPIRVKHENTVYFRNSRMYS